MSQLLCSDTFNRTQPKSNNQSSDSFHRADNSTSLGTTDGSGSLDPLTWVAQDGVWGISSDTAVTTTLGTGHYKSLATVDLGTGDVDILTKKVGSDANAQMGLVFRFTDTSNCWVFRGGASPVPLTLEKLVAGTVTTVFSGGSLSTGDTLRVQAIGTSIKVFRNGTLVASTTDSFNQTATKHGLHATSTTSGLNRFQSWQSVINPALPVGTDGGTLGSTDGSGVLDPLPWYQQNGGPGVNAVDGYGWGIITNEAYTPPQSWNPPVICIATVNALTGDVDVQVKVVAVGNQCALVWRFADKNNYWYWFNWSSSPNAWVAKVIGGTTTQVFTGNTYDFGSGDIIRVRAVGSSLIGYKNGTQIWTTTDSALATNTHHGIYASQEFPSSSPGGDPVARFQNFQIGLISGWQVDRIGMSS